MAQLERPALFWTALAVCVALVAVCELRTDEDTVTLGLILIAAATCGFSWPRRFWIAGLALGLAVGTTDLVMAVAGWAPSYQLRPPTVGGAASLVVLVVPAVLAAAAGAGLGALARRRA